MVKQPIDELPSPDEGWKEEEVEVSSESGSQCRPGKDGTLKAQRIYSHKRDKASTGSTWETWRAAVHRVIKSQTRQALNNNNEQAGYIMETILLFCSDTVVGMKAFKILYYILAVHKSREKTFWVSKYFL